MLEPIKSTKATTATQATEPSDAVRPISEQRPGGTLQDRLYRMPEIQGASKPAASRGNETSLFQKYSIAKSLPSVPLAAASSTNLGAQFSKYGSYLDYWKGVTESAKTPHEKMVVHYKGGQPTWYKESEGNLRNKYGFLDNIDSFVKSQLDANKRIKNRFFEDIKKTYSEEDMYESRGDIFKVINIGSKDRHLSKSELESIKDIAEREGLGQRGYDALIDQTYTAKALYGAKDRLAKVEAAFANPDASDWVSVGDSVGVQSSMGMSDWLYQLSRSKIEYDSIVDQAADVAAKGATGGALAGATTGLNVGANLFGIPVGGALGPGIMAPAAMIAQALNMANEFFGKTTNLSKAQFSPVKNGKIATSINDFSGTEKDNLISFAERLDVKPDDLVQMVASSYTNEIARMHDLIGKDVGSVAKRSENDNRLGYGGDTISQTQQYLQEQWGWDVSKLADYKGSYDVIFRR